MVATIECLTVDPINCPVSDSIYGYFPNKGANAFFAAAFAILFFAQIVLGLKWKTRFFMGAVTIGTALEAIGYGGRIMLADNPFNDPGFKLQIVCLTIGPAFLAAGIYVMLQQLMIVYGEKHSRLRPKYYTWVFISCDLASIVLQGIGGGISAGAETKSEIDTGNNTMIAGVSFQVGTLTVFALLVGDWILRVFKHRNELNPETHAARKSLRFKGSVIAIVIAFFGIFFRCVYRIVEMSGGWANPIMQDEPAFIVCESLFILISVFALTVQHPGYIYKINRLASPSPASSADAEKGEVAPKKRFGLFGLK
ncbi:MAG: hypothetical protein M1814_004285 [Vezdaea aestivalis]|nr:MAG: hypothetical protein M1814_004285 [Vezdaea aestivalis]